MKNNNRDFQATKDLVLKSVDLMYQDGMIDMELKDAVHTHPRTNLFITNLINKMNEVRVQRPHTTGKELRALIYSLTEHMIMTIKKEADVRVQSDIEKHRKEAEQDKIRDMEETLAGRPSGVYKDLGVQVDDSKTGKQVHTEK